MCRISQCLNSNLIELCERIDQIQSLNKTLSNHLPEPLRTHCRVGSFNKGSLVLLTNDPVWASELRYHIPELRDALRQKAKLYQLTSIKVKVDASQTPNQPVKTNRLNLSKTGRATIQATAKQCGYEPLKQAMLKLATNNTA